MATQGKKRNLGSQGGLKQEKETPVKVSEVVRDERTHKISGFALLIFSILLFMALVSYCFTWKQDQDKVFAAGANFLFAENLPVDNLLGRLGAWTGHQLIYNGFGLAAFLLCTFPFVLGVNLIFGKPIFSLWRNLKYVVTGIVFFSVALAYALPGTDFSYGGAVGEYSSQYLNNLMGKAGTGMLLFVAGMTWFIWCFNPTFRLPKRIEKPAAQPAEAETTDTPAAAVAAPVAAASEAQLFIEQEAPAPSPFQSLAGSGKTINELYAEAAATSLGQTETAAPVPASGNSLSGDEGGVSVILPQPVKKDEDPVNAIGVNESNEPVDNLIAVSMPSKDPVVMAEELPDEED
ncbi:MAG TPA: DNA translocase FtsK 4TM domain-containing protein, partial [Phnomibacter sp.]|nr:DNA translocase FtsK 4TM domain-containing protein [Phnomibacter sp.]